MIFKLTCFIWTLHHLRRQYSLWATQTAVRSFICVLIHYSQESLASNKTQAGEVVDEPKYADQMIKDDLISTTLSNVTEGKCACHNDYINIER